MKVWLANSNIFRYWKLNHWHVFEEITNFMIFSSFLLQILIWHNPSSINDYNIEISKAISILESLSTQFCLKYQYIVKHSDFKISFSSYEPALKLEISAQNTYSFNCWNIPTASNTGKSLYQHNLHRNSIQHDWLKGGKCWKNRIVFFA